MKHFLSLVVTCARLGLVPLGKVVEADPGFSVSDVLKFFHDLLLGVTGRLDNLPEGLELLKTDLAVVVDVDGVEELLGRDSAEGALPVGDSLGLVNGVAAINVEDSEDFVDSLCASRGKFLQIILQRKKGVIIEIKK